MTWETCSNCRSAGTNAAAIFGALRKARSLITVAASSIELKTDSTHTLELANGSRIISLPGKEETIRGFSKVALLILDEAAWVADDLYIAARPMLAVSDG